VIGFAVGAVEKLNQAHQTGRATYWIPDGGDLVFTRVDGDRVTLQVTDTKRSATAGYVELHEAFLGFRRAVCAMLQAELPELAASALWAEWCRKGGAGS
jgi:hypothetical protein